MKWWIMLLMKGINLSFGRGETSYEAFLSSPLLLSKVRMFSLMEKMFSGSSVLLMTFTSGKNLKIGGTCESLLPTEPLELNVCK